MSIEQALIETFDLSPGDVREDLELLDIPAWDSLGHMRLIMRLEDAYGVQFTGDEIADLRSVADIRKALRAHGAAA